MTTESFGVEANANTGWVGSGFANGGYIGVLLYAVLMALFFAFLDAHAKKFGARFVISAFLIPVATMITSSDLTNMILTHGLLFAIILLMILKPEKAPTPHRRRLLIHT